MLLSFAHGGCNEITAQLAEKIVLEKMDALGILYTVKSQFPLQIILDDYYYAVFACNWIQDSPYKTYQVLSQY